MQKNYPYRAFLTVLLLTVSFVCIRLMSDMHVNLVWSAVVGLILLVLAVAVGWRQLRTKTHFSIWLPITAALILFPFLALRMWFGADVSVVSFLYHFSFGIDGAEVVLLDSEIITAALFVSIFVFTVYALGKVLNQQVSVNLIATLVLLGINPLIAFIAVGLNLDLTGTDLAVRLATPSISASKGQSPDIVVVYLEGLEQEYESDEVFSDAFAPLGRLAKEGISFRDVAQVTGTGWSIAGIVASQCGVPLVPNGLRKRNKFENQRNFLTSTICLTDVLASRGYDSEFYVGVDKSFAGHDNFTNSHSFRKTLGLNELRDRFSKNEYEAAFVDWTVDDQMLYDTAKMRFKNLRDDDPPLLQVIKTISLHGKEGYLSRRCTKDGQATKSKDIEKLVRCVVEEAVDFVRFAQDNRRERGLRIVLMSDHLSRFTPFTNFPNGAIRRNTVIFLGTDKVGVNNQPGSMLDVYPSMLDWLGLSGDHSNAGLGVSLFTDGPTLVGEYGVNKVSDALVYGGDLAEALWK